ncbi:MAG: hypothetical protein JWM92_100 [Candidatus Nomurabacteria bacterium]|nr:hypothetical protein [Candidatus Nomurabacteria bacterium]
MRKAAMAVGLAAASTGALATEHHTETPDKPGDKTETVHHKENNIEIRIEKKHAWDHYLDWLEAKKLRGSEELDRGNKAQEMLQQFIDENPNTALELDDVRNIQVYFKNYREWLIQRVAEGKATLADGHVLDVLSDPENIPGSKTTSHYFPKDETVMHYQTAYDNYVKTHDNSHESK